MLSTLLIGGRYFESSCDICLQFSLVANRKKHTVAQKCTPNSNGSQQGQIAHTKLKSLTFNSNGSHKIQMAHNKFKSFTINSNGSHPIQIAHTQFKCLTTNKTLCINGGDSNILLSAFKLALLASFWVTYSFESLAQERG